MILKVVVRTRIHLGEPDLFYHYPVLRVCQPLEWVDSGWLRPKAVAALGTGTKKGGHSARLSIDLFGRIGQVVTPFSMASSAPRRVFLSSMVIVIGPTPPGTGVIAATRSFATSNSKSPFQT
jgi:hypothetical protein